MSEPRSKAQATEPKAIEPPKEAQAPEAVEPPFVPIAHIAPKGADGVRRALCGAPLLGIHASGEFHLCETCRWLAERQDRRRWQGPS